MSSYRDINLKSLNFTSQEDARILSAIKKHLKCDKIAKLLNRSQAEIEFHIKIKPSLRIAAMTSADDKRIAKRTAIAWAIYDQGMHPNSWNIKR